MIEIIGVLNGVMMRIRVMRMIGMIILQPIDLICSNFAAGTSMRWNRNCRELDSLNENRYNVVLKKLTHLNSATERSFFLQKTM